MARVSSEIHVHIVKNGAELVKIYSAPAISESGSNEVNVQLEKNDMVWMQNMDTGVRLQPGLWNCFSGALLNADV
ncbi:hypothetical protein FSP39_025114 [Pinctada imbricata]|uniref:C1q domain-containing protein n=1 Tax=Pinctada imbricata TaxID=66713 RepID=A0AA88YMB2_PINIB|nr:hypothetical protein FSP39_025114 [Pinctada imbricata]